MLKRGIPLTGNLENLKLRHRLKPLDHLALVWDRVERPDGINRHRPDVRESAGEAFDGWVIVASGHVENCQVGEVLGSESVDNIKRVWRCEAPDD